MYTRTVTLGGNVFVSQSLVVYARISHNYTTNIRIIKICIYVCVYKYVYSCVNTNRDKCGKKINRSISTKEK